MRTARPGTDSETGVAVFLPSSFCFTLTNCFRMYRRSPERWMRLMATAGPFMINNPLSLKARDGRVCPRTHRVRGHSNPRPVSGNPHKTLLFQG